MKSIQLDIKTSRRVKRRLEKYSVDLSPGMGRQIKALAKEATASLPKEYAKVSQGAVIEACVLFACRKIDDEEITLRELVEGEW